MERNIVFIALFAALIAALGLIPKITLAGGVPITAQSLGVMLCGTILGAKRGGLAALLFIVLTLIGLPLLAGGRGGIGLLATASVGFLVAWPLCAFVTGYIVENFTKGPLAVVAFIASAVGCIIVMYFFGIIGWAVVVEKPFLEVAKASLVFIPGDLIKAVIASLITAALFKARPNSVLSQRAS